MKIRVFSDIHIDVNQKFPFSIPEKDKDVFTLVAGDVSGNVKGTAKWIKQNIHNGVFIAGNHDPSYNELGWTIQRQKQYLAEMFPLESSVTFLDEQVDVVQKHIPGTNVLVVGSTLYTDYMYMPDVLKRGLVDGNAKRIARGEKPIGIDDANLAAASRGLNDFRWGSVPDEFDDRGLKQRPVRPEDYRRWFYATYSRIANVVTENQDRDIIVLTHHCPSPKCISSNYVNNSMNASYVSDLEEFIVSHPNIRAWCCGHVHSVTVTTIGDNGQLLVCNPRGYERDFECGDWTPNLYIDTDTWTTSSEKFVNPKLEKARKAAHAEFMKWAPLFM